jgi:hypothetical protein
MIHKKKVVLLALIAVLVLAALPVYAQTSNATQGVFSAEADDSLDVHNYGDVEFDTWFGYGGIGPNWQSFSLGYARKLGGIYLGLGYEGNPFTLKAYKEKDTSVAYDAFGNIQTTTNTGAGDSDTTKDEAKTDNTISVLLGLGGMGIKLEVSEDLEFYGTPGANYRPEIIETPGSNKVEYENELDSYSRVSGGITPTLTWGMALGKLKPTVSVGVEFAQDATTSKTNNYETVNGVVNGAKQTNLGGSGKGYIAPDVSLGIAYALKDDGATALELGLEYGLNIPLYNNEYDAFGKTGSVKGEYTYGPPSGEDLTVIDPYQVIWPSVGGDTTRNLGNYKRVVEGPRTNVEESAVLTLSEISEMTHTVNPSLTYTRKVNDEFEMGFSVSAWTEFGSTTTEQWTEGRFTSTNTYAHDPSQNTFIEINAVGPKTKIEKTSIEASPGIAVGTRYALLPGKVNFNSGFTVAMEASYEVERKTLEEAFGSQVFTYKDADGNNLVPSKSGSLTSYSTPVTETVTENFDWNGIYAKGSFGFTVFFTPKSALDLAFVRGLGTDGSQAYDLSLVFSLKK